MIIFTILKTAAKIIRKVVDGFATVVAFLLIHLGLWLPALFSLGFIIVLAIAKMDFSGGAAAFFYIGLVVSFLLSVYITLRMAKRKKAKAGGISPQRKKKFFFSRKGITEPEYLPETEEETAKRPAGPLPIYMVPPPEGSGYEDYRPSFYSQEKKQDDDSNLRRKYFGTPDERNAGYESGYSMTPAAEYYCRSDSDIPQDLEAKERSPAFDKRKDELQKRLLGGTQKPMVFALRSDPDMLVYEYPDKLEFYKKTKKGLSFVKTEHK